MHKKISPVLGYPVKMLVGFALFSKLLIIIFSLPILPALASDRYISLDCRGKTTLRSLDENGDVTRTREEPDVTIVLLDKFGERAKFGRHIDYMTGWLEGEFVDIGPRIIILRSFPYIWSINRVNGKYHAVAKVNSWSRMTEGTCIKTPAIDSLF